MAVWALGINHTTAPLDLRGKFAFALDQIAPTLQSLRTSLARPPEAAILSLIVVTSPFAALPWLDRWDRVGARLRDVGPSEDRRARLVQLAETRRSLMDTLTAMRDRAEEIE